MKRKTLSESRLQADVWDEKRVALAVAEQLEKWRAEAEAADHRRPRKITPENLRDNCGVDLRNPKFIRYELRDGSIAEIAVTREMRRAERDIRWLNQHEKKLRSFLKPEEWQRLVDIAIARYDAEFRISAIMPAAKAGWATSQGGTKGATRASRVSPDRARVLQTAASLGWQKGNQVPRGLPTKICKALHWPADEAHTVKVRRILRSFR